ncbi:MAG: DNA polymerase III subunit delta [Gammaproteobacteria bacterium RIFCSPHIGHO2_12_FULL_38_14]|nr:MAG: DNA polymerase III subunit delta [Gammaproteobacteria bacterium RIFCSPHIGHO2_12_FULL_38_14]
MKLNFTQLESHLEKHLAPIYVISGDEPFLKREAIQLLRQAAKKNQFNERINFSPASAAQWENLYDHLYSTSLFNEKRLLQLDCREILPNKTAGEIFKTFCEKEINDIMLVIDIPKLNDTIIKSTWYKALEKKCVTVQIWPITREQLPQWIIQRAKKFKLAITRDAVNLLAESVDGNIAAAAGAIEKLLLLEQKTIDETCMQAVLTDENRYTVFDLVDAMLDLNPSRMLQILRVLNDNHTEPSIILWSIARELRLLASFATQFKNGDSYEIIFQKNRVFMKKQPLIRKFLSQYTAQDCWIYLSALTEIDRIIKGAMPGNIEQQLQLFCLRMMGPRVIPAKAGIHPE